MIPGVTKERWVLSWIRVCRFDVFRRSVLGPHKHKQQSNCRTHHPARNGLLNLVHGIRPFDVKSHAQNAPKQTLTSSHTPPGRKEKEKDFHKYKHLLHFLMAFFDIEKDIDDPLCWEQPEVVGARPPQRQEAFPDSIHFGKSYLLLRKKLPTSSVHRPFDGIHALGLSLFLTPL